MLRAVFYLLPYQSLMYKFTGNLWKLNFTNSIFKFYYFIFGEELTRKEPQAINYQNIATIMVVITSKIIARIL